MPKERVFQKSLTISNFKSLKNDLLPTAGKRGAGKAVKSNAQVIAEVYYTPKGYRSEIHFISPVEVWDEQQASKLLGIDDKFPEGDLFDSNFDTILAAMHFITRRLKRLGWSPVSKWEEAIS